MLGTGCGYSARVRVLPYLMIVLLLGCAAEQPAPLPPEHPRHLLNKIKAFAEDFEREPSAEKARDFIVSFALTRPQVITLFGPQTGATAWKGYSESILPAIQAEAGEVLLREILEEKRNEVWVETVGPASPAATTRGDLQILDALAQKRPVYTARLRRPGEQLGLRLNGFVYIDNEWKALFKIYEHL